MKTDRWAGAGGRAEGPRPWEEPAGALGSCKRRSPAAERAAAQWRNDPDVSPRCCRCVQTGGGAMRRSHPSVPRAPLLSSAAAADHLPEPPLVPDPPQRPLCWFGLLELPCPAWLAAVRGETLSSPDRLAQMLERMELSSFLGRQLLLRTAGSIRVDNNHNTTSPHSLASEQQQHSKVTVA